MADKVFYDVVATGTSATTLTFFNHNEGDDGETTCNLSENRKVQAPLTIERIALIPASDITDADALKLMEKSIIKLVINRNEIIKMPTSMALASAYEAFGSNGGLTTGQTDVVGLHKGQNGYEFKEPVSLPANTEFYIDIVNASAFAADTNLTVVIEGKE